MAFPYQYNFNYYVGDTLQFLLYPKEDGESMNISNYSALFSVATSSGNSGIQIFSASCQISASTPYKILCTISPTNGRLLTGASYVYDVEITDNGNSENRYTLLNGNINTLQDIKRS